MSRLRRAIDGLLTWPVFVALVLGIQAVVVWVSAARSSHEYGFLTGDCSYYAAAARSLWVDGDWAIGNQLDGGTDDPARVRDTLVRWPGYVALSHDGRIVLKQSTLLALVGVPFYAAFGVWGFLVFNALQMLALVVGVAVLGGGRPIARLVALACLVTTHLLYYAYQFSADVLAAALLVWAFVAASRSRPLLFGLLAGLAVWSKLYLFPVLAPAALLLHRGRLRAAIWAALGFAVAVAPTAAINSHLFGSPWVSGYDREAYPADDGVEVRGHFGRFNQPLLLGVGRLLLAPHLGLVWTAPLWLLWPLGVWLAFRDPRLPPGRLFASVLAASLLLNLLLIAKFDQWNASQLGNRYLLPAVALGFVLQVPFWDRVLARKPLIA